MKNIAIILRKVIKAVMKFVFWVVFAFLEMLNQHNAYDYSAIVLVFMSFGGASVFMFVIILFTYLEHFKIISAVFGGIYFITAMLFFWFLKSQYNYNFLK
jgi:drug/metabolite transporter superfamily protein YnfA